MKHFLITLFCFCTLGLLASQPDARLQHIEADGLEIIVAGSADQALPELDIYLCIGQSNMAGRASFTDATADMTGIYLLDGANQFIPSPARMSQYSNVASDNNDKYWVGPHYQFALDVHAATGRPIGMVVNARGGSDIDAWMPSYTGTTQCYSKTLARLKAALPYGTLKGIIWHQGCNQAYGSYCITAASYYAKINEMVNALRNEVGDNDVWFIAGQLAEVGKDSAMHIKFNQTVMNDNIKSAVHNCDYVVSNEVTINPADPIHWDYAGACLMGGRYAKKILSHVYGKEFKVTYDLKGGSWPGQTPDSVIRHTTPTPTPVKDGAEFWGWFREKDFSGQTVKTLDKGASGTLYAKWNCTEEPECNKYGWATPEDMYQDLAADVIAAKKAGFAFTFASTFNTKKTFGKATNVHDVSGISYDIQTFDMTFFSKAPYKAKWGWLLSYMKARCKSEGVSAPTDNAGIRYNLAAFFSDGKGYSWDMNTPTADYTTFGVSSTEYYPMLGAILCDEPSALPEEKIASEPSVAKYIRDGQLFIRHEGTAYNILGIKCR